MWQKLVIPVFEGLNSGLDPALIKESELQDILNYTHDEYGRLVGRLGNVLVSWVSLAPSWRTNGVGYPYWTYPRVLAERSGEYATYLSDPLASAAIHNALMSNSGIYGIGEMVLEHPSLALDTDRFLVVLVRCYWKPLMRPRWDREWELDGDTWEIRKALPGIEQAWYQTDAGGEPIPDSLDWIIAMREGLQLNDALRKIGNRVVPYGFVLLYPLSGGSSSVLEGISGRLPGNLLLPHIYARSANPNAIGRVTTRSDKPLDIYNRLGYIYSTDWGWDAWITRGDERTRARLGSYTRILNAPSLPPDLLPRFPVWASDENLVFNWAEATVRPFQYRNYFIIPTRVSTTQGGKYEVLQADLAIVNRYSQDYGIHELQLVSNTLPQFDASVVRFDYRLKEGEENDARLGVETGMALYKFVARKTPALGSRDHLDHARIRETEEAMRNGPLAGDPTGFGDHYLRPIFDKLISQVDEQRYTDRGWACLNVAFGGNNEGELKHVDIYLDTGKLGHTYVFTNFPQDEVIDNVGLPLIFDDTAVKPGRNEEREGKPPIPASPVIWDECRLRYYPCSGMDYPRPFQGAGTSDEDNYKVYFEDLPYNVLEGATEPAVPRRYPIAPNSVLRHCRLGMWRYRFAWEYEDGTLSSPSSEVVIGDLLWSAFRDDWWGADTESLLYRYNRTSAGFQIRGMGYQRLIFRGDRPYPFSLNWTTAIYPSVGNLGVLTTTSGLARWGVDETAPLEPHVLPFWGERWYLGGTGYFNLLQAVRKVKSLLYSRSHPLRNNLCGISAVVPPRIQLNGVFGILWLSGGRYKELRTLGLEVVGIASSGGLFTEKGIPRLYYAGNILRTELELEGLNNLNIRTPRSDARYWAPIALLTPRVGQGHPLSYDGFNPEYDLARYAPGLPSSLSIVTLTDYGIADIDSRLNDFQYSYFIGVERDSDSLGAVVPARPIPADVLDRLIVEGYVELQLTKPEWAVLVVSDEYDNVETRQEDRWERWGEPWRRFVLKWLGDKRGVTSGSPVYVYFPERLDIRVYLPAQRLTAVEQILAAFPSAILFKAPRVGILIPEDKIPPRAKRLWIFRSLPAIHNDDDGYSYGLVAKVDIPWAATEDDVLPSRLQADSSNCLVIDGDRYLYFWDNVSYDEVDTNITPEQYEGMVNPLASVHAVALNERVYYANFAEKAEYKMPVVADDRTRMLGDASDRIAEGYHVAPAMEDWGDE